MPDTKQLLTELLGDTCRCGSKKSARQTFCRACYFKLTKQMRADLYRRIGEGYSEAYAAAVAHLEGDQ